MSQFENEMREFMGRVDNHMENQTRWTASVSHKVDVVAGALQSHKDDTAPHGAAASQKTLGNVIAVIGGICGVCGLIVAVWKLKP